MTQEINEKELQDKEDLIKKWVAKFKKAPIQTSIILLMTFGSMGVTTWIGVTWRSLVSNAVVHQLEEEGSDIHNAVVDLTDSVAAVHTDSLKTEINVENAQIYAELFTIVKEHGDGSMTDEELSKDIINKLALMDSMEVALPKIEAMTEWMAVKMDEGDNSVIMCGYVISEDDEPTWWVECDGDRKKIKFGQPSGILFNRDHDIYYYRNDDDKPILLSSFSNY